MDNNNNASSVSAMWQQQMETAAMMSFIQRYHMKAMSVGNMNSNGVKQVKIERYRIRVKPPYIVMRILMECRD